MRVALSVLALILIFSFVTCENPGLNVDVKLPVINKIRDKYFTTIFTQFGHQTVPDMKSGDLEIKDITIDMTNASPDNLKIGFNEAGNALSIEVDATQVNVHVNWHYSKSIFSVSGDAKIEGPLSAITMNLGLVTKAEDTYFIPQVTVANFNAQLNKGAFNLDFHCDHCPGAVEDLIADILKDQLIDQVSSAINDQVPSQLNTAGNEVLEKSYPRSLALYNNIDVATGLSSGILVKADHIEVPLDSTVFLHDEGYKHAGATPEIPTFNPEDPGEIMVFLNTYLLSTLSDTLNKGVQSYSTTVMGIEYKVELNPTVGKTTLAFEEGDFDMNVSPTITAVTFGVGIEITADAKINPKIIKGDDKNMFSVTPEIKGLNLSVIKLVYGDKVTDVSYACSYLNTIVETVLNMVAIPTIAIPKQAMLPLHVTNSELDFHPTYSEFGIVFDFGHQE